MENTDKPHPPKLATKLRAIIIISIILIQCFALVSIVGFVRPVFAQADIYSAENTIYMNVTEPWVEPSSDGSLPSTATSKIISITVKDNGEIYTDGHQVQICSDEGGLGFAPDAQQAAMGLQIAQQSLNPGVNGMLVGDREVDLSVANRYVGGIYTNGSWIARDPLSHNFGIDGMVNPISSPVIRKSVLFDTPQNTAEAFCAANSYSLLNVINSTYDETINTDLMNLYQVKGEEHELYVVQYSTDLNASSSGGMETEFAPIVIVVVVVVVVVSVAIIAASVASVINMPGVLALEQRKLDAWLSGKAIDEIGKNARAAQDNLLEWQEYCLDLYANGSITWEEMQAMLEIGGAPYRNVVGNATTDIQGVLDDYYDNAVDFRDFGAGFGFSWTDIWFWIIIAIVAGFAIYIVYVFIKRWGNKKEIQVKTIGGVM